MMILAAAYNKFKRAFRFLLKKTVLYKIYKRVRYAEPDKPDGFGENTCKKEFDYGHMLNANEYRFLKYKKYRNHGYRIEPDRIRVPYKKGLVSVILPVYNGADYIDISIKSILAQTYKDIELIIIDDGSTDGTSKIVDHYGSDKRVKVIHQENRKLPRTLSRGFRQANGEYFTWTSADNIMHPEFVAKFVADLRKYGHTGMIYGNMRLIDENGNPKTDFEWYRKEGEPPEHVMLPKCPLELNTYANNYVGAAFMYRAVLANVVEDYSAYKFGIEDYDYWMKINELFVLRHTSFDKPEYSYRLHSQSLTSKDKELKITENRYKQMLLDEFRRDYYRKAVGWIVLGDHKQCRGLLDAIKKYGQKLLTLDQANRQTPNLYERYISVCCGKVEEEILAKIPQNAFKVLVEKHPVEVDCLDIWDAYVCMDEVLPENKLPDYKGWFGIGHGEDLFAFVDSKARNRFLYELEADGALEKTCDKTFSVIISYHGNLGKLDACIASINEHGAEIIIVGSYQQMRVIREKYGEKYRYIADVSGNDITRKNMAARSSQGKYLVFAQDGCCFKRDYFENLKTIFSNNKKAGTVFGDVEGLAVPSSNEPQNLEGIYMIGKDGIYSYQEQNIPSGYSFAIRNGLFKMAGGFYHFSEGCKNDYFCDRVFFGTAMA